MIYPEYIQTKDGTKYKLNTDFKVALECFKIINNPDIDDTERAMAIQYKLLGDIYMREDVMELCLKYLQCGKEQDKEHNKPDVDFQQDEPYIIASFMSDYHVDLSNTSMHWWHFVELLNGLSKNCVLSSIREIRNIDLSNYKDPKARAKIIKAMKAVEIKPHRSEKQQEMLDEFESLFE